MDIRFYDLSLNLIHILPPSSQTSGYVSMNCKIEFQGDGSFELSFWDDNLVNIIKNHPEGIILKWGIFEGISTDYSLTEDEKKLFGKHLNNLLVKSAIPPSNLSGNVQTLVYKIISDNYDWLETAETQTGFENVTYKTDKYTVGNTFVSNLCARGFSGYYVYLDIPNKKYKFKILKTVDRNFIFSENKLNAYEIQEDFDGKNIAFGGWYEKQNYDSEGKKTDTTWTYIKTETKHGVYKQDVILKATDPTEAEKELKTHIADYTVSLKTKNVKYGTDYNLGENVRLQHDGITTKKYIIGVELWHENTENGEQPILGELKEVKENG